MIMKPTCEGQKQKIEETEEELKKHRDHLEDLVAARTNDLQKANEDLRAEITERRRAEDDLKRNIDYFRLHSDIANTLIKLPSSEFGNVIRGCLKRIVAFLGVDRGTLIYWPKGNINSREIYCWNKEGTDPYTFLTSYDIFPYASKKLMKGENFLFSNIDELPSEAQAEKTYFLNEGIQSTIKIPMVIEGKLLGVLMFDSYLRKKTWPDDLVQQIQLIGQTFTYSLERKLSEEELLESEEILRAIFENVNDEIVYVDNQGIIINVNSKVEDIFGYKPEEVIGKSFSEIDFCTQEGVTKLARQFTESVSGGFKGLTQLTGKRKDGTEVFIEVNTSVIKKEGEIKHFINVIRDITERKELEIRLQQAHKMDAIGTLAGGIAHEFNNILGIIVGNTELAMEGVPEWNAARHNLEEIRMACLRARNVVRQILAFSRQTNSESKPIRLSMIIEDSVKLLRSSLPTIIEIRQKISTETDTIMADSTQVSQIILNLCTNAAHAMRDEGGLLEISLEDLNLDEKAAAAYDNLNPGKYVKLAVSDTGTGIKPDIIEHLFNPYFTTKGVGEGTGMGLAVVHGLVKDHGGDITVHSEPNKGSTFCILLPVIEAEANSEIEFEEPVPRGNERVLFVDDEKSLVLAAKNYLEDMGYDVVAKRNPIEALDAFKQEPETFDLIITDMTMPNMTGDMLAEEIMKIRPHIPVILCTGFSDRISEEKTKEMGIKALIKKPALASEMAKTIRLVLAKGNPETAFKDRSILVVDDEEQLRSVIGQMLKAKGFEVSEAPNGKVALRLFKEKSIDLIITDLIMPEKEGIETIIEIKQDFPHVKVVAISGGGQNDPDAYLAMAKKLGAEATLTKPFEMDALLKAVEELVF